jgi:hypothetical protein
MKTLFTFLLLLAALVSPGLADTTNNPLSDFAALFGLTSADQVKKIEVDITGDGRLDVLLCYVNPTPDIEERRVAATGDKRLWWNAYIKNADGSYSRPTGIDPGDGNLRLDAVIAFDPLETYIGQVSEISRFALVTREKQTPRSAEALSIIWAFTWEDAHLKQQKLGEFQTGQQNALFDKYLIDGKRTVLQVQQVTP